MLVDATWQGQPRKLLLQANRNGFFYVLDRTNGKLLLGTQYVKNITWATGLDARGAADRRAEHGADARRASACARRSRARRTGTRRRSTRHRSLLRADQRQVRHLHAARHGVGGGQGLHGRHVRPGAASRRSGSARHRHSDRQGRPGNCRRPARSTRGAACSAPPAASSFFGEDSGAFMAADAATGKVLWSFQTSQMWKASPMTYMFDNKQYIAIAAGPNILAFGL